MYTSPLAQNLSLRLFLKEKPLNELDQRILERGEYVLKTIKKRKFSKPCILRYARLKNFELLTLERLIERLRYRRHCLLHASWIKPLNLKRWLRFQKAAKEMQDSLQELFIEFYRHSGDPELIEIISHIRFVNHETIKQMVHARREFEKQRE